MALIKQKTLACGASGSYWKITNQSQDKNSMTGLWTLSLFEDKAHSDSKYPSIEVQVFSKHCTKEEFASNATAIGYALIKTTPEFSDAEDA